MPTGLLWLSQLRFLRRHALLTALAVLGIALGVAVIHATDLANRSASASLEEGHRRLHGFAQFRVVASGQPVTESAYAELRRRWLAAQPTWRLQPVISASLRIGDDRWQLLGIDPLADPRVDTAGPRPKTGLERLIGTPTAMLSVAAAQSLGLATGDTVTVEGPGGRRELSLLGTFADPDGLLARLIVTDIGTAQRLAALSGQLSYLELVAPATLTPAQAEALRDQLPPGLQLIDNDSGLDEQNALVAAFQFNLAALSLLALLVGFLLMLSVAQFSFWLRQPLLEGLHRLGVGRRQLLGLLLAEALGLAALACALGWLLGELLGRALLPLLAGTVNELFTAQPIARLGADGWSYLKTALLAAGSLLAATLLLYARQRHQTAPRGRRYWLSAAALATIAIAALWGFSSLGAAYVAIFAGAAAWLLVVPELYRAGLTALRRITGGPVWTIALRDSQRHYRRLALALAALCLALAAALGIELMVAGFRHNLLDWLDRQTEADLYVSGRAGADTAALADTLHHDPRLATLTPTRRLLLPTANHTLTLLARPLDGAHGHGPFELLAALDDAWPALQGDAVLAGEPLARRLGLAPGDTLTLPTPAGPRPFRIAGIFRDYSTDYGRLGMDLATYRRHWPDRNVDALALHLRAGADAAALQRELQTQGYNVAAGARIKAEVAQLFDRTFAITRVLGLLIGAVAVAALASTLLIHQLMLRRQLATLRALGLSRWALLRLLLLQALGVGAAAGLLALPLGYGLAWLLATEINPRAFGWSLGFQPESWAGLRTVLAALALALLAALYPAWRAARAEPARELARE